MKTLLLVLAVAAYVCLGSDVPRGLCFQCNRRFSSDCSTPKECRPLYTTCYTLYTPDGKGGEHWALTGCGKMCPTARYNQRVTCCNSPACNSV